MARRIEISMDAIPKIFSSDYLVLDEHVALVVDTNILIEFETLSQISWQSLCPNAASIKIVVPGTVVREMDAHKKGASRIRRRALEFNKSLISIEDGNGKNVKLVGDPISIILELMPRYSNNDLSQEKLSLDSNDDRIIAETIRYSQDNPKIIFLSDDNNARRTAREMGLLVARPVEEWRRKEPRDDRDTQIEGLKRQLGALPYIKLPNIDKGSSVVFETLRGDCIPMAFCDRVADLILLKNPGRSREELLQQHNLPSQESSFMSSIHSSFRVSVSDVDNYCADYKKFEARVINWTRSLPGNISKMCFAAPFLVDVENSGNAFAEHVEIAFTTSQGYGFIPRHIIQQFGNFGHKAPDLPTGFSSMHHLGPTFFEQQRANQIDPFEFYAGQLPDLGGSVDRISFECQKLRHGSVTGLSGIVYKLEDAPKGGLVTVTTTSASLAEPVHATLPIRTEQEPSEDFQGYLLKRLEFFPDDIRDVIKTALGEL